MINLINSYTIDDSFMILCTYPWAQVMLIFTVSFQLYLQSKLVQRVYGVISIYIYPTTIFIREKFQTLAIFRQFQPYSHPSSKRCQCPINREITPSRLTGAYWSAVGRSSHKGLFRQSLDAFREDVYHPIRQKVDEAPINNFFHSTTNLKWCLERVRVVKKYLLSGIFYVIFFRIYWISVFLELQDDC